MKFKNKFTKNYKYICTKFSNAELKNIVYCEIQDINSGIRLITFNL